MEEVFLKLSTSHLDTKWQGSNVRLASKGVDEVTANGNDVTRNGQLDTIFEDASASAISIDKVSS